MITVDVRGMLCPQPIIETKRVINSLLEQSSVEVLVEDQTVIDNLVAYLGELGIVPLVESGRLVFDAEPKHRNDKQVQCLMPASSSVASSVEYAVVVKSAGMGSGSDELGRILLKAFLSTLEQSENLPSHLIFYNEGVCCCTPEFGVAQTVQALEDRGVSVIVCGTCVDYFGVKDSLSVGVVSNMYKIVEMLSSVSKVVYP